VAGFFQVVALDLDGTLTTDGTVRPEVLAAVGDVRDRGLRTVLATGRIRDEMFAGRLGRGATCNGRPMRASAAEPQRARINLGFNFKQSPDVFGEVVKRLFAQGAEFARYGSAAMSLASTRRAIGRSPTRSPSARPARRSRASASS